MVISFAQKGIGAGLESMTVNGAGWDGSINPKVCIFYSVFVLMGSFIFIKCFKPNSNSISKVRS